MGRVGFRLAPVRVNGQPGAQLSSPYGGVLGVLSLGVRDGRVLTVYNQINPDKLTHLGTVDDLTALLAGEDRRPPQ